mmetsp:Transcript_99296/g.284081  ORF Transcript_99296/g.284081 Transcript_99296/m.284081 type:complete len:353 (-) Transcript_99296:217-1275(-)
MARDAKVRPVIKVGLEHLLRNHVHLRTNIFILHHLCHRVKETEPRTHHLHDFIDLELHPPHQLVCIKLMHVTLEPLPLDVLVDRPYSPEGHVVPSFSETDRQRHERLHVAAAGSSAAGAKIGGGRLSCHSTHTCTRIHTAPSPAAAPLPSPPPPRPCRDTRRGRGACGRGRPPPAGTSRRPPRPRACRSRPPLRPPPPPRRPGAHRAALPGRCMRTRSSSPRKIPNGCGCACGSTAVRGRPPCRPARSPSPGSTRSGCPTSRPWPSRASTSRRWAGRRRHPGRPGRSSRVAGASRAAGTLAVRGRPWSLRAVGRRGTRLEGAAKSLVTTVDGGRRSVVRGSYLRMSTRTVSF